MEFGSATWVTAGRDPRPPQPHAPQQVAGSIVREWPRVTWLALVVERGLGHREASFDLSGDGLPGGREVELGQAFGRRGRKPRRRANGERRLPFVRFREQP